MSNAERKESNGTIRTLHGVMSAVPVWLVMPVLLLLLLGGVKLVKILTAGPLPEPESN